jgi:hypothetical protein
MAKKEGMRSLFAWNLRTTKEAEQLQQDIVKALRPHYEEAVRTGVKPSDLLTLTNVVACNMIADIIDAFGGKFPEGKETEQSSSDSVVKVATGKLIDGQVAFVDDEITTNDKIKPIVCMDDPMDKETGQAFMDWMRSAGWKSAIISGSQRYPAMPGKAQVFTEWVSKDHQVAIRCASTTEGLAAVTNRLTALVQDYHDHLNHKSTQGSFRESEKEESTLRKSQCDSSTLRQHLSRIPDAQIVSWALQHGWQVETVVDNGKTQTRWVWPSGTREAYVAAWKNGEPYVGPQLREAIHDHMLEVRAEEAQEHRMKAKDPFLKWALLNGWEWSEVNLGSNPQAELWAPESKSPIICPLKDGEPVLASGTTAQLRVQMQETDKTSDPLEALKLNKYAGLVKIPVKVETPKPEQEIQVTVGPEEPTTSQSGTTPTTPTASGEPSSTKETEIPATIGA